jgi:hypothetical protein
MQQRARRGVGIISDGPDDAPLEVNADAHTTINDDHGSVIGRDSVVVEDVIVSLQTNASNTGVWQSKSAPTRESLGIFRAFEGARGKENGKEKFISASSSSSSIHSTSAVTTSHIPPTTTRHTHIFSVVERFTFRPSPTETDIPNLPLKLPLEI